MILEMALILMMMTAGSTPIGAAEPLAFKPVACDFFTYDNAVKVLGGKVTGADDGMTETADSRKWGCTFTAVDRGDKPPKLHFRLIKNKSDELAKINFESIRQSNNKLSGFEEWPGVGDEAVVHIDGKNFQLVVVRKGAQTISVKVNPADGVSIENLKSVAVSLVPKLSRQ